jgi:hypothetical protein
MLALFSQQNIRGKLRGRFGYGSLAGAIFLKTYLRLYSGSMEERNDQMEGRKGVRNPFLEKRARFPAWVERGESVWAARPTMC